MTDSKPQTRADLIGLASSLRERAGVDASADVKTQTDAMFRQMQRDRLVWAMAPAERGGFDATLSDIASITFQLAKTSGSLGLTYAMHASQAYTMLVHAGGSAFLESLTNRLIADQTLVASGTSEKGPGGNIFGSVCTVEENEDGTLSLSKDSPNISYLDHAAVVLVTAMRPTAKAGKSQQVLVAAETTRFTFEAGPDAVMMGMQGILNRPYSFTGQFEADAVFGEEYPRIAGRTMTPIIHILWAALWSGLAAHALEIGKAFVAKSPATGEGAELMRVELSRLANKHYTMNALIRESALTYEQTGRASSGLDLASTAKIKRLKVVCSELLEEVCMGTLGVIGFAAYAETGKYSLSEIIRDSMSARVMISNNRLLLANSAIERFVEDTL